MIPVTLRILKHHIIAIERTVARIDDGALNDTVRRFITDTDCLMNKVDRFIARVALEFNSGTTSGLSSHHL